jgi:hypothetical protein
MNFIETVIRKKLSPDEFFEDYIRIIVENSESVIYNDYGKISLKGETKVLKVVLDLKTTS